MPQRLLPIPHRPQQAESDCLVACAAMALAALGIQANDAMLSALLDTKSWGTPHRNIQRLAEAFSGLHITYRQGALPDLFHALDAGFGVTVFVWTGELPYWTVETWHAVVIIGYDEHDFFVNDPAFAAAPQRVSHGDLDLAWIAYDAYYAVLRRTPA